MKRYSKFGYAAPFRFRVILEKQQGGGAKMTPPPGRRLSARLNGDSGSPCMSAGSVLYRSAARKQNRRFPISVRDRGTIRSWSCLVLRSRVSATVRNSLASTSGSPTRRTLCIRDNVWKVTISPAESQPSFWSRSDTWSNFLRPKITFAEKLIIFWISEIFVLVPLPYTVRQYLIWDRTRALTSVVSTLCGKQCLRCDRPDKIPKQVLWQEKCASFSQGRSYYTANTANAVCSEHGRPEANIIKKKDKLLGRFIPYFTCKIWNKDTQYVVLFKHDILGIFISYFTRKIWNKTTQ